MDLKDWLAFHVETPTSSAVALPSVSGGAISI